MNEKIIAFCSGEYTLSVIEMLTHHRLQLVITTEIGGQIIDFLKQNNIFYISSHLKEVETIQKIKDLLPTVGVLASYGAIVPQNIIDLFPEGIWNIHPSLLPKYKGPSPIQTTILNGDRQTGVTIIKLDNQVDHGPILAQKTVELSDRETQYDLKHSLFKLGGEMIDESLNKLENDEHITADPQDHSKESFTPKITKENGYIDINNVPEIAVLDRMIRAYFPWPGVWTKAPLFGRERIIKLFPDEKIQVEGKRVMTYKEFVNGYQEEGEKILEKLNLQK